MFELLLLLVVLLGGVAFGFGSDEDDAPTGPQPLNYIGDDSDENVQGTTLADFISTEGGDGSDAHYLTLCCARSCHMIAIWKPDGIQIAIFGPSQPLLHVADTLLNDR